ncbi:MAG: M64 family metallopeptidase, partial [bacterium]
MVALLTALLITASTCSDNSELPEAVEVLSSSGLSPWVQVVSPTIEQFDLVFVGEGFRDNEEERELFHQWVDRAVESIEKTDPLRICAFNIHRVLLKSVDAGADHVFEDELDADGNCVRLAEPDCRNTALNTTYGDVEDGYPCWWLYTRTTELCEKAAEMATDDWDFIVVVVNDDLYGGWANRAINLAITSCSPWFEEVFLHELAHVVGDLEDEYAYKDACYPYADPGKANVTTKTALGDIPWKDMIDPGTPIVTTESALAAAGVAPEAMTDVVGLWEGAAEYKRCIYRPQLQCRMNELGSPFCLVCANELETMLENRCLEDYIISSGWKSSFRMPCLERFVVRLRLPPCLVCLVGSWAAGAGPAGRGPDQIRITMGSLPVGSTVRINDESEATWATATITFLGELAPVEF